MGGTNPVQQTRSAIASTNFASGDSIAGLSEGEVKMLRRAEFQTRNLNRAGVDEAPLIQGFREDDAGFAASEQFQKHLEAIGLPRGASELGSAEVRRLQLLAKGSLDARTDPASISPTGAATQQLARRPSRVGASTLLGTAAARSLARSGAGSQSRSGLRRPTLTGVA